jgi:Zn-dependent protease
VWLTSGAAVLTAEAALLLHELSHAVLARRRGHHVQRIVFHGFMAETEMAHAAPEVLVALAGPSVNLALALVAISVRWATAPAGPGDLLLVSVILGNAAAAMLSLVPLGDSDGRRAVRALQVARGSALSD